MNAAQTRETKQEKEQRGVLDLHFKYSLPLPHSFCSITCFFFSFSLSASLPVVTDASSLLFVLALFKDLFLDFVSVSLCHCEFLLRPASSQHPF